MGGERYLSVSRTDILDADAELRTASGQVTSDSAFVVRDKAMSVVLNCGEVCAAKDDKGVQPFDVTAEPIPGENEAHCGIRNSTDKQSRGYVNQLRAILVRLASHLQNSRFSYLRTRPKSIHINIYDLYHAQILAASA